MPGHNPTAVTIADLANIGSDINVIAATPSQLSPRTRVLETISVTVVDDAGSPIDPTWDATGVSASTTITYAGTFRRGDALNFVLDGGGTGITAPRMDIDGTHGTPEGAAASMASYLSNAGYPSTAAGAVVTVTGATLTSAPVTPGPTVAPVWCQDILSGEWIRGGSKLGGATDNLIVPV